MDRFERTPAPDCLAQARGDLCHSDFTAHAVWDKFRKRKCYDDTRTVLLNISGTTCAFCAGGFAQSPETIEHFRPKAGAHAHKDAVLDWANLFPACMRCQQAKGESFSLELLKPDEPNYSPWQHFIANADDGSLEPLHNDEPHRAQVTIQTYDLNRAALKIERRRAIRQLHNAAAAPLEEYRFLAELFPA